MPADLIVSMQSYFSSANDHSASGSYDDHGATSAAISIPILNDMLYVRSRIIQTTRSRAPWHKASNWILYQWT